MDYKDYQAGATQQHFWFKAKNNLIEVLLNKATSNKKMHILDIGAGTGGDVDTLNKFGFVHVVDINQAALDLIPNELVLDKKCCDTCNLSYENNAFDMVVAFDVLEHIKNDQQAVSEIFRVLKPGGFFIFTVPAYQWLFGTHDHHLSHVRRYNKAKIKNLLKNFNLITLGSWLFFLFPFAAIARLLAKNTHKKNEAIPNKFINWLMYRILNLENILIKRGFRFPWGLTIYGIYRKPNHQDSLQKTF